MGAAALLVVGQFVLADRSDTIPDPLDAPLKVTLKPTDAGRELLAGCSLGTGSVEAWLIAGTLDDATLVVPDCDPPRRVEWASETDGVLVPG